MSSTTLDHKYSFKSPRRQLFSLPPDVISSMLENPSSHKGLSKLYQTCKYFYGKRPIIIINFACLTVPDSEYGNPNAKLVLYNWRIGDCHLQLTPKIWLTETVTLKYVCGQKIPKFYRFSMEAINVDRSDFQYDDFVRMTSENMVTSFHFNTGSTIHNSDGSEATIDQILQHLPNIEYFEYFIDIGSPSEMWTNLNKLQFTHKFGIRLRIFDDTSTSSTPVFDFSPLCEFIQKNTNSDTDVLIPCWNPTIEKLKPALQKLDPKWKKEAHQGLKKFFMRIDPNWGKEE